MNLLFGNNRKKEDVSSITYALNKKAKNAIRWCTPSIDRFSSRVVEPYDSDVSVSYQSLGFPSEPSGIFKKAYDRAARAYGADHTLFSVNGSTGSNFMVLKALSKQIPNLRILSQRNVHKSVVTACEDYSINLMFLPPKIDSTLQIFLPNTVAEIMRIIKKTKPQVLLITNPTYEGIVLDVKNLVKKVRSQFPDLIIYIEEAWGAHLHFSKKLPVSAMNAGADICIQSTHKQGGSLQQSGMIHWKDGKINSDLLMTSFRNLSTSSPSYLLLASLDAAREMMEERGNEVIDHILDVSKELRQGLATIPHFNVINIDSLRRRNPSVFDLDETKIIVNVSLTGLTGYEIAKLLEEKNIIVEAYNMQTLVFLVPFRAISADVKSTIKTLRHISSKHMRHDKTILPRLSLKIPKNISKILEVGDVGKLLANQTEKVPLEKAQGRISAENITPYPPGIPTTIKGEEFTSEIIKYYQALRLFPNSHIIAHDKTLESVLVVK